MGKLQDFIAARGALAGREPSAVTDALAARLNARPVTGIQSAAPPSAPSEPTSPLTRLIVDAAARNNPAAWADIRRIIDLPVIEGFSPEERAQFRRENEIAEYAAKGYHLFDVQVDAILTFLKYGNLFAPIGVGHGKTAITVMLAGKCYRDNVARTALMVPSQVVAQLWTVDIPWIRQRFATHGCPFHLVTGSAEHRRAIVNSGRRGCYIIPWSIMSTKEAEEMLKALSPEVIFGDEAHNLRSSTAARTKRVMRYIEKRNPPPRLAWLSGTITSKSLMDYHHMVAPFGSLCPLPRDERLAAEWAAVLDAEAEPDTRNVGPIKPLIEWAIKQPNAPDCPYNGTGFRRAFRHRLNTSPCVVATGDAEIGVSLTLAHQSIDAAKHEGFDVLADLMKQVDELYLTPSGDEIEHAMHTFKWLYELSAGFYNDLYWPPVEKIAKNRGLSDHDADALLTLAQERHGYLQEYHKVLRRWLKDHHIVGLDTPMLVGRSLALYGASEVKDPLLFGWWLKAKAIEKQNPGLPERDSKVVRVCDYKVKAAVAWAKQFGEGIIWYYHHGVGDWLHELLPDALYCPAGPTHNSTIIESKGKLVIASVTAHGTGKNLQFHQNMLYTQFPRAAQVAEQSIGRIHRTGQTADELIIDCLIQRSDKLQPPTFDELVFAAMLNDACYVQQTTGLRQKVMFCTYSPVPKIIPGPVLLERGLDPQLLSREAQLALQERFSQ